MPVAVARSERRFVVGAARHDDRHTREAERAQDVEAAEEHHRRASRGEAAQVELASEVHRFSLREAP
jgi:hypothetical protein